VRDSTCAVCHKTLQFDSVSIVTVRVIQGNQLKITDCIINCLLNSRLLTEREKELSMEKEGGVYGIVR
jgi:hypothetical protein